MEEGGVQKKRAKTYFIFISSTTDVEVVSNNNYINTMPLGLPSQAHPIKPSVYQIRRSMLLDGFC